VRILLGVHQFFPEFRGGTEILTLSTARELKARGHDITVLTGFPAPKDTPEAERFDSYDFEGLPVERFFHAHVHTARQDVAQAEYNNLFFASRFRGLLTRLQPDVVHFFHLERLSASALEVCHDLRIPTIYTPTDYWAICPSHQLRLPDQSFCPGPDALGVNCIRHLVGLVPRLQPIRGPLQLLPDWLMKPVVATLNRDLPLKPQFAKSVSAVSRRLAFMRHQVGRVDAVLAPNRSIVSVFADNGFSTANFRVIPYGISQHIVKNTSPKNLRQGAGGLRLGFIGTLSDHKGAHVLLEATRLLSGTPLQVDIYGATDQFPEYAARLRCLAAQDPRITLRGTFDNGEIGTVMSSLDALVIPSLWRENTPLVLYSAQMAKLPVIASDVAGIAEVVEHGVNGLLFRVGDAQGLASNIRRVLDEKGLLQRLSAAAKPPKSITQYADELVGVYTEVAAKREQFL
jgi:glycosyltransferase involved in cell wall biosynthesis